MFDLRIVVFSDTHGKASAVEKIISQNPNVKHFIFLGDGERELERISSLHTDIAFYKVCGNCDYASFLPDTDILVKEGKKIIFTHGHNHMVKYSTDGVYELAKMNRAHIVLFGHTHQRYLEYRDGIYILNPGSAALPRDLKPPSYAFIDIESSGIVCSHVDL